MGQLALCYRVKSELSDKCLLHAKHTVFVDEELNDNQYYAIVSKEQVQLMQRGMNLAIQGYLKKGSRFRLCS